MKVDLNPVITHQFPYSLWHFNLTTMAESPVALTIDDVRNYVPTNNIDRNTLMLLERLKYDEDICSFDDKICPAVKINWDLIKRILISKTDLNKKRHIILAGITM